MVFFLNSDKVKVRVKSSGVYLNLLGLKGLLRRRLTQWSWRACGEVTACGFAGWEVGGRSLGKTRVGHNGDSPMTYTKIA